MAAIPDAGARKIERAFHPVFSPFWIAFVAFQWWLEIRRQLADALPADAPAVHAGGAAALGAAGHIAGNAIEALFYVLCWRARGARLSFTRLFEWLVTLSVLDLLSVGLARFAESHPGWVAHALEVFVGFGALGAQPGELAGARLAFGSVGLLTIARLAGTAAVQQRGTGGGYAGPLVLTLAVWLLGRLASWWIADLTRGMSPLF
jgi:hypothetical protein